MSAQASNAPAAAALLTRLVQLEKRARACEDRHELSFVMVNETATLVQYRQAAIWVGEADPRSGKLSGGIAALSGLASPAGNSAFNVWLGDLLARHAASPVGNVPSVITPAAEDLEMWQEYLPEKGLWLPLALHASPKEGADGAEQAQAGDGKAALQAGLAFWREEDWGRQELAALTELCDAYAHAWRALDGNNLSWFGEGGWRGLWRRIRRKRWKLWLGLAVLAVMLFPVRQSVLAPAEVVPRDPFTVRAPLQGVVERIIVQPNASVQKGDLLVLLDAQDIRGKLEFARQTLAVAEAELRQGQQQALFDERSKASLGLLQGQRDQSASDVEYLEGMLERTEVRADRPGVAVFDDPQEWSGRPVALGERIMVIADPQDIELEANLPLADAIELRQGAEVRLFMNSEPASPVAATLVRVGYRAMPVADGTLAYRARAAFVEAGSRPELRIGLKGTAKLYGKRTILAAYLLRRPLTTLRLWLGI